MKDSIIIVGIKLNPAIDEHNNPIFILEKDLIGEGKE